eukprot:CAMPEP_0202391218 /NCGR_PEP_ID=MMETSP1127-20130417/91720_1 /ASSEMBLY_ACC=CAM_ASM_000462 /TAXON_ID=3047 /ORGANISM="Dunaliella tertiolecta, Strain CCMP1320" /LENGTH=807 /DNA_ID=CAMNT_0048993637 /DNA_START=585 /DNA_END=3009 /DNA_ORIENTATION=-
MTQTEHPQVPAPCWESLAGLMEAIPLALVVVSSDGTEVLRHMDGSEPAAAQALRQVLQQFSAAAQDRQQATAEASSSSSSSSACSFLAALLGPKMADIAMGRAHKARSWKGSVTMHLPCGFLSGSSRAPETTLSGVCVSTPTAAGTAEAVLATAGLGGGEKVELAKSALRAYVKKSSLKRGAGTEHKDPVGSLERHPPRKTNSFKSVRWGSLQTEPESSFQHDQDKALSILSSEVGDPREVALPGGSHNEEKACPPVPAGVGGISAPVFIDTFGSSMEADLKEAEAAEPTKTATEASARTLRRSKSISDLRLARQGSQSPLLRSERDLEQFMLNDDVDSPRTKAFLRSLLQKMEASSESRSQLPPIRGLSQQFSSKRGARSSPQTGDGSTLHDALGLSGLAIPAAEHNGTPAKAVPETPDNAQDLVLHCFDVVVSLLQPRERERSPLIVLIANSTQHLQVQSTLSTLAESQLELLSSIMPQHAIQFLALESTAAVPGRVAELAHAHKGVTLLFMDALESTAAVPGRVAELAHAHKGVTLLFMDIVGFTSMCKNVEPVDVMVFLNTLFSLFDQLTDIHGVHKVETAGDCYIVSGGIMSPKQSTKEFGLVVEDQDPTESAMRVMEFAKALLDAAQQVKMPDTKETVRVRVGMHTGDVVSGLIGSKLPKFSIFGDTMNTASRMESTGLPGRIHVSETTHKLLQHTELWEPTGGVEVKGKGKMQTFLWLPQPHRPPSTSQVLLPIIEKSDSEVSETLPGMLLKTTHALFSQLHKSAPSFHAVPQERTPSESQAFSLCLFERELRLGNPASL